MGIVVACRCGQAFEADLDLAGKVVQCPVCHSPLSVPTPIPQKVTLLRDDYAANQALATTDVLPDVPGFFSPVSRENREAAESMRTILVAGVVVFMVVAGLSTAIILYLKGSNPIVWIGELREQERQEREAREARDKEQFPAPALDGPIAVAAPPTFKGLPPGWGTYEHPDGKFSAVFPAAPECIEQKVESVGGVLTSFILSVTHNEHVYEATRESQSLRFASEEKNITYDILLKKRERELPEGKIEGSKTASVNGRLVCDAILSGKEGAVDFRKYMRLIAYENTVFELSCRVPLGQERPAEISAFLANYRLQK